MSFVFISHANADKGRIRPIVDRIISQGHKVFLDRPAECEYSDEEIARNIGFINYGGPWKSQLKKALKDSFVVLVIWSNKATEKSLFQGDMLRVWFQEISYAVIQEKALHCKIDDLNLTKLPEDFREFQFCDLDTTKQGQAVWNTHLDMLVRDINEAKQHLSDPRTKSKAARAKLALPLLADRDMQKSVFLDCLRRAAEKGGACPFIVTSPANELPDQFMDRLQIECIPPSGEGNLFLLKKLNWAILQKSLNSSKFESDYRTLLMGNFEIASRTEASTAQTTDDQRLAKELAVRGLLTFVHRIHAQIWRRDEPERIRWLFDYWKRLATLEQKLQCVPVVLVSFKDSPPPHGIGRFPPGTSGGRVAHRDIVKALERLVNDYGDNFIRVAEPLGPIDRIEADSWRDDNKDKLGAEGYGRAQSVIESLYRRGRAKKHGLAHRDFLEKLKDVGDQSKIGATKQ